MASPNGSRVGSGHSIHAAASQNGAAAIHAAAETLPAGEQVSDTIGLPATDKVVGADFLFRTAERFGVPIVLVLLLLWWARNDIVQPLLNAHFDMISKMVDGQEEHTSRLEGLGRKLDELISVTKDNNSR
jgi:hypothetical protein